MYTTPALHLAPTPPQPLADPSSASPSSSDQPAFTPSTAPTKNKELEQPLPANMVDLETEETVEVA